MTPQESHDILLDKGILPPPPIGRQDASEETQKRKVINALQRALFGVKDALSQASPYQSNTFPSEKDPQSLWKSGVLQEIAADLRRVIDKLSK